VPIRELWAPLLHSLTQCDAQRGQFFNPSDLHRRPSQCACRTATCGPSRDCVPVNVAAASSIAWAGAVAIAPMFAPKLPGARAERSAIRLHAWPPVPTVAARAATSRSRRSAPTGNSARCVVALPRIGRTSKHHRGASCTAHAGRFADLFTPNFRSRRGFCPSGGTPESKTRTAPCSGLIGLLRAMPATLLDNAKRAPGCAQEWRSIPGPP
jgi:hypothetical protein